MGERTQAWSFKGKIFDVCHYWPSLRPNSEIGNAQDYFSSPKTIPRVSLARKKQKNMCGRGPRKHATHTDT